MKAMLDLTGLAIKNEVDSSCEVAPNRASARGVTTLFKSSSSLGLDSLVRALAGFLCATLLRHNWELF